MIEIEKDGIKTHVLEDVFEEQYEPKGWVPVKDDWTKRRKVKPPVDLSQIVPGKSLRK